jgi:hypothetical protein
MLNIAPGSSEKIVDADDLGSLSQQSVTKMRAQKARAPRDYDTLLKMHDDKFRQ